MAGSSWPTLTAGNKARASDVEAKFDWIEGNIVPMTGGNTTDGAFDLGTSLARWRSLYTSSHVYLGGNLAVGTTSPSTRVDIRSAGNNTPTVLSIANANASDFMSFHSGQSGDQRAIIFWDSSLTSFELGYATAQDGTGYTRRMAIFAGGTTTVNVSFGMASGTSINQISADGTFSDNSDNILPTQKAVKTYADFIAAGYSLLNAD